MMVGLDKEIRDRILDAARTPFGVVCDNGRLPQSAPALSGWWRVQDNYVLTLVVAGTDRRITATALIL